MSDILQFKRRQEMRGEKEERGMTKDLAAC